MTILVSGASGIVGYGILRSLKNKGYKLIGTTIYDFSVAPAFCDIIEKVLPTNDPNYIDDLCRIILKHKVNMIISGIECDMFKWNQERETLQTITFPLLNNKDLIELCYDKWIFYEKLNELCPDYAIPTIPIAASNVCPVPFLLKPRHGFGSKGIIKIKTKEDIEDARNKIVPGLMTQPIIGSDEEEYTVSGFFDSNSKLIDYFPLRRRLSKDGFTNEAEVKDREFKGVLIDLAKTFNPVGPTNFQFRFDGDVPKLLEINPRISSATSIRALLGYNESVMSVDYFLNDILPVVQEKPTGRKAMRYMEDLIF
jgi:carbamoyl-phosphate synthase large subunit